jgi:hypothetical protein
VTERRRTVGVVVARRKLVGPWADHSWSAHAVLPAAPALSPWTMLGADGAAALFYAGPASLALDPSGTAHYRDNLASGRASLWVALELLGDGGCRLRQVTADPYEGEALTEGVGTVVEAVAMPAAIAAELAEFCAAFTVERTFLKRARERADPEALARPARRRAPRREAEG